MLVTLIGIFSFVSGMYSISIRMSTVQFQSSLRTAYPSILLRLVPLLFAPVLSRLLCRVDPRWLLAGGLIPLGAGQLWLAAIPLSDTSLLTVSGPAVLIGMGFILMVSSFTAAAVNSVPPSLAGMASASSSLVRDFPQALGPAIMTSIAVSWSSAVVVVSPQATLGVVSVIPYSSSAVARAEAPPISWKSAVVASLSLFSIIEVASSCS